MADCATVTNDNIVYLQQGLELLGRITDADYTRKSPATYNSSVGGHLRHCIDHYLNFLGGLPSGKIDYDARARDPRIEQERGVAVATIERIIDGLRKVSSEPAARALHVKMDCGDDSAEAGWWSDSSVQRECQFLISHTVHHYALIGLMLKTQGLDIGPSFGVAPSTLRYMQSHVACAR